MDANILNNFSVVGLVYDISGVVILGRALALVRDRTLKALASTYWDANLELLESLIQQRYDTRWGVGLLILGFILQALGAIGLDKQFGAWWLFIGLVVLLIIYLALRKRIVRAQTQKLSAVKVEGAVDQAQAVLQNRIFS